MASVKLDHVSESIFDGFVGHVVLRDGVLSCQVEKSWRAFSYLLEGAADGVEFFVKLNGDEEKRNLFALPATLCVRKKEVVLDSLSIFGIEKLEGSLANNLAYKGMNMSEFSTLAFFLTLRFQCWKDEGREPQLYSEKVKGFPQKITLY